VARSIPAEIRASLAAPLGRLAGLDPFNLLIKSIDANKALLDAQAKIGAMRRSAVRHLRAEGYTLKEIGDVLGVKPQRIHQLETGYDRTEKKSRRVST
jgi:DNA-directed RNA polymerase specialized sigma24 family protein